MPSTTVANLTYIYIYIYIVACGVMAVVVGIGHGDPGSIFGRGFCITIAIIPQGMLCILLFSFHP